MVSETIASNFAKQVKLIVESLETNLKLLKSLKATEAKKYTKEVELLQTKFAKVMETGKKAQTIQIEIEAFEREKEHLKKRKLNFSKSKNMDSKAIQEKILLLTKHCDKLTDEFNKSKEELRQQTKDFNEAKLYILRTFNAHSASIDLRFGDNLDLYKKNITDFINGLRIATVASSSSKETSPELAAHPFYSKTETSSKANSVSASSEDDKSRRIVN